MIRFRFGRDDLLRTRFAIAPLIEIAGATYVVRAPNSSAPPSLGGVGPPQGGGLDLSLLYAVSPFGASYWPNFDAPPPTKPHPDIDEELERVVGAPSRTSSARSSSPTRLGRPRRAAIRRRPGGGAAGAREPDRVFWEPPSTAVDSGDSDPGGRDRAAGTATGHGRLGVGIEDLDPTVTWHGDELRVRQPPRHPRTSTSPAAGCC